MPEVASLGIPPVFFFDSYASLGPGFECMYSCSVWDGFADAHGQREDGVGGLPLCTYLLNLLFTYIIYYY
jgi:hypothetical protein